MVKSFPGSSLYWEVFQRYWWFLPAAAITKRAAFRLAPAEPDGPAGHRGHGGGDRGAEVSQRQGGAGAAA